MIPCYLIILDHQEGAGSSKGPRQTRVAETCSCGVVWLFALLDYTDEMICTGRYSRRRHGNKRC